MIINNPQEYFVIVRCISCTDLGLGEDRCFRSDVKTGQNGSAGNNNSNGNIINSGNVNNTGTAAGNDNAGDQPGTQAGNPGGVQTGNQDGYSQENQNGNQTGSYLENNNEYQSGNQGQNQMGTQLQQGKNIDGFINDRIRYIFFKVTDLCSMTSMKQIYRILNSIYTSIINAHVNNIPCFAKVKNGEVEGVNLNDVLNMHIEKFKNQYDYLVSTFNCTSGANSMDDDILNRRLNELDGEINNTLKEIMSKTEDFSIEEIFHVYETAERTLINLMVQYVPCFKQMKGGFNGKSFEEIANMHYNELRRRFYQHVSAINCD